MHTVALSSLYSALFESASFVHVQLPPPSVLGAWSMAVALWLPYYYYSPLFIKVLTSIILALYPDSLSLLSALLGIKG